MLKILLRIAHQRTNLSPSPGFSYPNRYEHPGWRHFHDEVYSRVPVQLWLCSYCEKTLVSQPKADVFTLLSLVAPLRLPGASAFLSRAGKWSVRGRSVHPFLLAGHQNTKPSSSFAMISTNILKCKLQDPATVYINFHITSNLPSTLLQLQRIHSIKFIVIFFSLVWTQRVHL